MARPGLRMLLTLGVVGVFVACTSTYGEEEGTVIPDASAPGTDAGGAGNDATDPPADGSGPRPDATTQSDSGNDAGSYAEACPPCNANAACVAAGCSGDATYNSCSKPFDITAPMSLVAFVCPEGSTIDFPQMCVPGGATKGLHVAVFRMGMSPGSKKNWKVGVRGSNSFVSSGSCDAVTACGGGTDGPSQPRDVAALATAMIGTTNPLTTCQQLMVTFADDD